MEPRLAQLAFEVKWKVQTGKPNKALGNQHYSKVGVATADIRNGMRDPGAVDRTYLLICKDN